MKTKGLIKKYKRNYDLIISLYSLDMLDLTQRQLNRFIKKRQYFLLLISTAYICCINGL